MNQIPLPSPRTSCSESIVPSHFHVPDLSRRKALGLLGFLGATVISASAAPVNALLTSADLQAFSGIGSTSLINSYAKFLSGLDLKHVTPTHVLQSHSKTRSGVHNCLPPQKLWKNLVKPLKIANALAERLGEDVEEVISAYRSPAYNRKCGGAASNSQHLKNAALDLVFRSSPAKVARTARQLRAEGFFKGGVGLYSGFTHVDARGYNADW